MDENFSSRLMETFYSDTEITVITANPNTRTFDITFEPRNAKNRTFPACQKLVGKNRVEYHELYFTSPNSLKDFLESKQKIGTYMAFGHYKPLSSVPIDEGLLLSLSTQVTLDNFLKIIQIAKDYHEKTGNPITFELISDICAYQDTSKVFDDYKIDESRAEKYPPHTLNEFTCTPCSLLVQGEPNPDPLIARYLLALELKGYNNAEPFEIIANILKILKAGSIFKERFKENIKLELKSLQDAYPPGKFNPGELDLYSPLVTKLMNNMKIFDNGIIGLDFGRSIPDSFMKGLHVTKFQPDTYTIPRHLVKLRKSAWVKSITEILQFYELYNISDAIYDLDTYFSLNQHLENISEKEYEEYVYASLYLRRNMNLQLRETITKNIKLERIVKLANNILFANGCSITYYSNFPILYAIRKNCDVFNVVRESNENFANRHETYINLISIMLQDRNYRQFNPYHMTSFIMNNVWNKYSNKAEIKFPDSKYEVPSIVFHKYIEMTQDTEILELIENVTKSYQL